MRGQPIAKFFSALILVVVPVSVMADNSPEKDPRHAVVLFGGVQLDNPWSDIFKRPRRIDPTRGRFVGVAGSTRLYKPLDQLSIEFEVQAVRHVIGQHHWEFNAAPIARWSPVPSNGILNASVAYGLGLSHATEKPKLELENERDTARTLVYWVFELAAGPVDSPWEAVARVHHRSSGYGLLAEHGGYNGLVLGIRRRF